MADNTNIKDGGNNTVVAATKQLPDLSQAPKTYPVDDNANNALGNINETAPTTDTASSGLNGRLQRIAQRLTTLIGALPASLGAKTGANSLSVTLATDQTLPLPTGAGTAANQSLALSQLGATNETAPASDTATVGLNGRLQRIAQRLTSLIALFPASLGSKTSANSFPVVIASDQAAMPVTVSKLPASGSYTFKELSASTVAADIAVANANRVSFSFTNNSATIAVWVAEGVTAVVGSKGQRVLAGGTYIADTSDRISVIAESGTVYCSGIES